MLQIGDCRITAVRAGSYLWDGGAMFGVVPKTLWSKQAAPDELNRIECAFNCFVIETGGKRLLVETGGGVRHDARALERMGIPRPVVLNDVLREHGFEPDSIDTVINTHLHWDHCGGNTLDDGEPAFVNARYVTQQGELMHAREQHVRDAVSYRPVNYEPLVKTGRMQLLAGDTELVPGVELRVMPGHNRDMMVVIARSGGETWCHCADLIAFTAQIPPTWVSSFDLFPLESIANKTALLNEASRGGWWCSFAHDPTTPFAKIEQGDGKWKIQQSRP